MPVQPIDGQGTVRDGGERRLHRREGLGLIGFQDQDIVGVGRDDLGGQVPLAAMAITTSSGKECWRGSGRSTKGTNAAGQMARDMADTSDAEMGMISARCHHCAASTHLVSATCDSAGHNCWQTTSDSAPGAEGVVMTSKPGSPMYIVNVEVVIWHDGRYLAVTRAASEEVGAGEVAFPGGKVDLDIPAPDILEETARREVLEEVGLTLTGPIVYVESHTFGSESFPVLDVVMLSQAEPGDVVPALDEVERAEWLTYDDMLAHPQVQLWTRESLSRADGLRRALGWS